MRGTIGGIRLCQRGKLWLLAKYFGCLSLSTLSVAIALFSSHQSETYIISNRKLIFINQFLPSSFYVWTCSWIWSVEMFSIDTVYSDSVLFLFHLNDRLDPWRCIWCTPNMCCIFKSKVTLLLMIYFVLFILTQSSQFPNLIEQKWPRRERRPCVRNKWNLKC